MDEQARQEQLQWTIDKLTVTTEQVEQKLADQIKLMQNTVEQLTAATKNTQQELAEITQQFQVFQQEQLNAPNFFEQSLAKINQQSLPWISGGIAVVLALLFTWIMLRRKPKLVSAPMTDPDDEENEDEYDFLGSEEGIPAKLDLARAYLAMEDFPAATEVLQDVLAKGNHEQRNQAQNLLQEMGAPQI